MNTIKECWEIFEEKVLTPAGASEASIRQAKYAFYAGIKGFVEMQGELASQNLSNKEAAKYMAVWSYEIHEFASEVMANVVMAQMKGNTQSDG